MGLQTLCHALKTVLVMHSRAYLLIERELEHFTKEDPWGIEVRKSSDDSIFQWIVKLHGLKETDWEDGVFQLTVQFDEEFHFQPPVINFLTIPFHPNVEPTTGYVTLNLLLNNWTPSTRLTEVLCAVQSLLAAPDPYLIINQEAGDLLVQNTTAYRRLTAECVRASQQLDEECGGVEKEEQQQPSVTVLKTFRVQIEYSPEEAARRRNSKIGSSTAVTKAKVPAMAKVNFEDYLATWNGIATSKATEQHVNSHLQMIENNPKLISVHHCLPLDEIETQLVQQMEQHRSLTYGNISTKRKPVSSGNNKAENLDKISQMRKMYISQRTQSNLSRREPSQPEGENEPKETAVPINSAREFDEPEQDVDKEVDDLVAWTEDLDAAAV